MSNWMAAGVAQFVEAVEAVDLDAEAVRVASREAENPDAINVSILDLDIIGDDVISGRKKSSLVRPGKLKHWQRRSVFVSERRVTLAVSSSVALGTSV